MAPVLIAAKILIQDLWMAGLEWDAPLPASLRVRWTQFITSLSTLNSLQIPRWPGILESWELHAFSDASERAYAAAIYLRGVGPSGTVHTSLLVAKTKVAPIKPTSIPRLELCGALLAARLLCRAIKELRLEGCRRLAWTDARVVLAWIRAHPSRWATFVANRVAAIQELLPADHWHYIRTSENPADLGTRGIPAAELKDQRPWWHGPAWLESQSYTLAPDDSEGQAVTEELRAHVAQADGDEDNELLTRFSSLTRLLRVSAFCLRFLRGGTRPGTAQLGAEELHRCRLRWYRLAQRMDFAEEIGALSRGAPVPGRSPLSALRPFCDRDGLIRVGGRLGRSPLTYSERHPIVLSKRSHLSLLIVRDAHIRTLHGGPQLTRSVLARQVWILQANSLIRAVVRRCTKCVRFRGATAQQQMGHLPSDRVQSMRPFWSSGVDYAGPLQLRASKGRGQKSFKGYVSLFVCLSTRAVHLEAVSDLTAGSFLAAFRRFVSRRGHCARLLSDNATNFRGAERELRDMFRAASEFYRECEAHLASRGTEWKFIPPSAPHFGGLWEAGVKATKFHLRRVMGDQLLTYEELSTLLCQVEACLNSRPLYPLSSDPSDFQALTPGHLLIGESPVCIPEPPGDPADHGVSALSRLKLISNMRDHFWRRWSCEYLSHLQQLGKWRRPSANLQPGALVLLKDELLPPARWSLGRIVCIHPGSDGLVRVVTVRTATSEFRRPVTKICPLPVEPSDSADGPDAAVDQPDGRRDERPPVSS